MHDADRLFQTALRWLEEKYADFLFRTEHDVVTVLWAHMVKTAMTDRLPLSIDYERNLPTSVGRFQCDIVIFDLAQKPEICIEVKYEPSRTRPDIINRPLKHSLPKHLLPGHGLKQHRCDIERLPYYVRDCGATLAYAIMVDEDSYHRSRMDGSQIPNGTRWIEWRKTTAPSFNTAVMLSRYPVQ